MCNMYIFIDYLSGQKRKNSVSRHVEPSSCRKFSGAGTCLRIWHCTKLQQDGLIRLLLLVWMDTTSMIFESFLDLLRAFGFPYLWNWCDACIYILGFLSAPIREEPMMVWDSESKGIWIAPEKCWWRWRLPQQRGTCTETNQNFSQLETERLSFSPVLQNKELIAQCGKQ